MAGYVIVDVEVHNPEGYKTYTDQVPATVAQYGGRFAVRGGDYETREGHWQPKRIVVLEFPTFEAAKAWYDSPEYQAILPIRLANSHCNFFTIVEGYEG
jgi:uncharacterized protein (DUF1330 family)